MRRSDGSVINQLKKNLKMLSFKYVVGLLRNVGGSGRQSRKYNSKLDTCVLCEFKAFL